MNLNFAVVEVEEAPAPDHVHHAADVVDVVEEGVDEGPCMDSWWYSLPGSRLELYMLGAGPIDGYMLLHRNMLFDLWVGRGRGRHRVSWDL
jgi:hypothetical protein